MAESTTTVTTLRRPPHGHGRTSVVANTRRNNSAHGEPNSHAGLRRPPAMRRQVEALDTPVNDSIWPQPAMADHLVGEMMAMAAPPRSRMTT